MLCPKIHVIGEKAGGLGSGRSYAVLCDRVAQVFLSVNFKRGKR